MYLPSIAFSQYFMLWRNLILQYWLSTPLALDFQRMFPMLANLLLSVRLYQEIGSKWWIWECFIVNWFLMLIFYHFSTVNTGLNVFQLRREAKISWGLVKSWFCWRGVRRDRHKIVDWDNRVKSRNQNRWYLSLRKFHGQNLWTRISLNSRT